jgi:hypothetical protein
VRFHKVKTNNKYIGIDFYFILKCCIYGRMMVENDKNMQLFLNEKCVVFDEQQTICVWFSFRALSQNICFFHLGLLSDIHGIYSIVVTVFITIHSCIYPLYNICTITRAYYISSRNFLFKFLYWFDLCDVTYILILSLRVNILYLLVYDRDVALTTQPYLARSLRKSRAVPLIPLWAFVACSRVKYNFTFQLLTY